MRLAGILSFLIVIVPFLACAQTPTPTKVQPLPGCLFSFCYFWTQESHTPQELLNLLAGLRHGNIAWPTDTPTLTVTPTGTLSPTFSPSVSSTYTATPSLTDTGTPSPTQTFTDTITSTASPTHTPTETNTATPTATVTITDTITNTPTPTDTITQTPTITSTPTPTGLAHFREEIEEEFRNSTTFDLEREVARVMLDPRVPDVTQPQWKRESYQAIIDAARAARLAIDDPYDDGVTHAQLFPTDVVTINVPVGPGNYPGKTTYSMRYVSDSRWQSKTDTIWGDNEDVVYVTGSCVFDQLRILPGTIVLTSAFQNDLYGKALTGVMLEELRNAFVRSPGPGGEVQSLIRTPDYINAFSTLYLGILLARGSELNPVLICSDSSPNSSVSSPTPYDWKSYYISQRGVMDYCIILNNAHGGSESGEGLTFRTLFHDHLETGRNGPGWAVGCYFGDSWNECIDAAPTNSTREFTFLYNDFESVTRAAGITISGDVSHSSTEGPTIATIKNNTFSNQLGVGSDIHNASSSILIQHNSFYPFPTYIINVSEYGVDARYNWWSTVSISDVGIIISDGNDLGYGPGIVTFQPLLTSPDSDRDGLTNDEEAGLGTDPDIMDTDGDFLIDGLEVNQYHTNPLNPDSDGDGIPDGIEVFRETDPNAK